MPSRRHGSGLAVLALAIGLVAGCGSGASPSGEPPAPTPIASDIAYAMHQRAEFGLRADEAWVESVAADPRARTIMLDFPMLPEEEASLVARQATIDRVVDAVHRYAADHPDEFGGVYIDPARGVVVTRWTAHPAEHRLAILRELGAMAPLEARQGRWTEQDLDALLERISADWDWMRAIGAQAEGAGVETLNGIVSLQISSANPAAPALILAHYGVGPDMLRVDSDGTGILLLPRGTVRGTVVTAEGGVPRTEGGGLQINWTSDQAGDGHGDCGSGDIGYGVGDGGRFELPCAPGGWTITIEVMRETGGNPEWAVVGSGHVVVPPGGAVPLRIVLDPGVATGP